MKITLKVNTNDNDRIEMWNGGCLMTIAHIDDLFPRGRDKPLRETLYREYEMKYNLEEAIDG